MAKKQDVKQDDLVSIKPITDNQKREVSARAKSEVVLSIITKKQLLERIDSADPILRLIIAVLIDKTRDTIATSKSITQNRKHSVKEKSNSKTQITDLHLGLDVIQKIRYEKQLHEALEKNELEVHFQPIVSLDTQNIVGFESLTRWNSPENGKISPDVFMGIAEETSLIVPLGHWIIERSCQDFAAIQSALRKGLGNIPKLFCSINVSGRQIEDPDFFDVLQRATWANKIKPNQIKLEITERVIVSSKKVMQWIEKCREVGYSVALDDFGTGYSSLSYLSQIDANNIKIDKSFVDAMESDNKTFVILKSVIQMAHGLNKTVISEGIETAQQAKILKQIGCRYGQGYLFSKPLSKDDMVEFLLSKTSKKKAA